MSSRVFAARSSHRPHDPQLCGLSDLTGCNPIQRGEMCLYLTCLGDAAQPVAQIERSGREDGFSTGFRVVASGRTRTVSVGTRFERQVPVFKWQQRDAQGRWHDVVVWERMVHADCARRMGYRVSSVQTTAIRGRRTTGHAHIASPVAESPLMDLARVGAEPVPSAAQAVESALAGGTATIAPAITVTPSEPSAFVRYSERMGQTDEARSAIAARAAAVAARNRALAPALNRSEPVLPDVDTAAVERFAKLELDDAVTVPEIEDTAAIERFRRLELD